MTKTEFKKVKKYLKGKLPDYNRFKLCKTTGKPILRTRHDIGIYMSVDVETLFDIINELLNKKD